jgi:hypothetical protein
MRFDNTTTRPDNTTTRPDNTTTRPDNTTTRPDNTTTRPDNTTTRPAMGLWADLIQFKLKHSEIHDYGLFECTRNK